MNVLIVEDDNTHAELIQRSLARRPRLQFLHARTAESAIAVLDHRPVHVVLLDYSLPDRDGLTVLNDIRRRDALLPVIFLTSADSADVCLRAMKAGAIDYIVKKRDYLDRLAGIVEDACPRPPETSAGTEGIVGDSDPIRRLRTSIIRTAASEATALILGETGTGKELVARAIHEASAHAHGSLVPVNCSEIPEALFESELFGHTRGSFTGAVNDRKGLLEAAGEGTLFLDEVEDLPWAAQVKLLRVLQNREFKPVGSNCYRPLNARIVAASNRDLEHLVDQGRFRHDLFFRLDVLRVTVPALRERRDDIPRLVRHFLHSYNARTGSSFGSVSSAAIEVLKRRQWPGNVRELENLIERTLANSPPERIDETAIFGERRISPDDERARIVDALRRNRWSRECAASELGMSRVTLWRRMVRYGLYNTES